MSVLAWVAFGFIAGVIAHLLDPADVNGGIVATTLTGIIGALLGGFLASTFLGIGVTGFDIQSFIIAVAGSLILVFLERALFRRTL